MEIFKKELTINWMGHIGLLTGFSLLLVAGGIVLPAVKGLNFGIDFAGGYEIQVKFDDDVAEAKIESILAPLKLGDLRIQRYGREVEHEHLILLRKQSTLTEAAKAQLRADVEALAGGADGVVDWSVAESGERLGVRFAKNVDEAALRQAIEGRGLKIKSVTRSERADEPEFHILLVSIADDVEAALRQGLSVPSEKTIVQKIEFVGPQVGAQLRNQGIMALLWALVFVVLYIAVRFDLFFAPGAVVCLFHDVAVTVGVFALFGLEFNLQTIAALLTIIGYSLNDTIVVYDRVRENLARLRGRELRFLVSTSINQTMSRTLLTGVTTMLVIVALVSMGGGVVQDFAVALFVGIVAGTYSSISIAAPLYVLLRERYGHAGKTATAGSAGGVSAPASAGE